MIGWVRFGVPGRGSVELGHGDVIGRLATNALPLDDPRVSEAHALVSLRRGELVLLSLRRMFAVRGKPLSEIVLAPGMVVQLAEGVELTVEEIERPEHTLAIEAPGLGRTPLSGTASVHLGPPLHVSSRFEPDAALHVWWNGEGWRTRVRNGASQAAAAGDRIVIDGVTFALLEVPVTGGQTTPGGAGAIETPLRIVAHWDTVEIHRAGRPPLTLSGVAARIVSELVSLDGPADWRVVASEVWSGGHDLRELRHRWDVTLGRLRTRLKSAGIRADLLQPTGTGQIQLVRYPADEIEDHT